MSLTDACWIEGGGHCGAHRYHCWNCGEPTDDMVLCDRCAERHCEGCDRVMMDEAHLHRTQETLDEPLPCGMCDLGCCKCFQKEAV